MDPERGWMMLQRLTNSTGDTVDLSAIPPQTREFLKSATERAGGLPLPESGIMTKAAYLEHHTRSEAARASASPSPGGPGRGPGGGPGGGFPGGGGWGGMGPGGGGGWGGGDFPAGGWDQRQFEKKETEEERPIAMRYGKLPKDLPSWFDQDDTDKDGQIGLYEWRKAGKDMKEFTEMDLNNDGFVTADEYLRFARQRNIDAKIANYEENGTRPANWGIGSVAPSGNEPKAGRGPGGFGPGSGGPGMGGPKGGDRGSGEKGDRGSGDRSERGSDKGGDRKSNNPWSKGKN
ncbi:EF-hand domain-containing protein [Gemmata sp. G18]|uniref:EF-hand domain-containing protein n=1 Tax=Gemmata palustris TaxID=2822762 RepID=A0ABS5BZP6_9BACT|nr:EF-hand domain-containing protein [Gemmata palustris]MBP3959199.1 EF-hand domain-containing protein [Gemmata palustris]